MKSESYRSGEDRKIHGNELSRHSTNDDCWVVIHGRAYDVTDFKEEHPGGKAVILKWAGKDATATYEPIHAADTLDKYLDPSKHMGEVDMSTLPQERIEDDPNEAERQQRIKLMPNLNECFNLTDFEAIARMVMKKTAWAYYSSGADDEIVSLKFPIFYVDTNLFIRQCGKIILLSTRFGSGRRYWWMLRQLISRLQCLAQRLISRST